LWLGVGCWLIGFALLASPDSIRFAGPLAGGIGITLAAALTLDLLARRAPQYLAGAFCLAVAAIAGHWILAVEPAVIDEPDVLARMQRIGASLHFPPEIPLVVAAVGLVLLARSRTARARRAKL
jgi:hypothetical protein